MGNFAAKYSILNLATAHCHIGCACHSELNIPKSLLSRAVKSNCLGLSCPDASAGNSGWCFELPRMWGFHPYHFCLLHSAPWPSNMIWNSVLPLTALTAISIKTIPYFLVKNSVLWKVLWFQIKAGNRTAGEAMMQWLCMSRSLLYLVVIHHQQYSYQSKWY